MNNNYIKLERRAQAGFRYFEDPDCNIERYYEFKKEVLEPRAPYLMDMLTATETTEEEARIKRILAQFDGILVIVE
ncbi:MAG: hypothetical protein EOM59_10735 [Clostridia bacterium]|nr:hypothetical protein [Clostridia bacterium]